MYKRKRKVADKKFLNEKTGRRGSRRKTDGVAIAVISVAWALFQLALPRFIILDSITIRAVHLAFAITLVFLTIPSAKRKWQIKSRDAVGYIPIIDYVLAGFACLSVLYIVLDWTGISMRAGMPSGGILL